MITIKELIESESKEVFYTSKDNEKKERARNNFSITLNDIDNIIPNKNTDKFVMIPSIIYESYGKESKSVSIYKLEEIEKLDLAEELKIDIPFKGGIKEWEAEDSKIKLPQRYGIMIDDWNNILGYYIPEKYKYCNKNERLELLAYILYEMTFYGYDHISSEETIAKVFAKDEDYEKKEILENEEMEKELNDDIDCSYYPVDIIENYEVKTLLSEYRAIQDFKKSKEWR